MIVLSRLHLTLLPIMLCWWLARCQSWPTAVGDFDKTVAEASRPRRHELHEGHGYGHLEMPPKSESEASSLSEGAEAVEKDAETFPTAEFAVRMSERPDRVNLETTPAPTTTTTQYQQKVTPTTVVEQDAEILPEKSEMSTSADTTTQATSTTAKSMEEFPVTDKEWEELRQKLHMAIEGISSETLTAEMRGRIKRVLDEVIKAYREDEDLEHSDDDHHDDDDDEPKHPFVYIHSKAHKKVYKIDLVLEDMLKVQRTIHHVFDMYPH